MELLESILAAYDWRAPLAVLAIIAVIVKVAKTALFKVPLFSETRALNIAENKRKQMKRNGRSTENYKIFKKSI